MLDNLDDDNYVDKWSNKKYDHLVYPRPIGVSTLSVLFVLLAILVFYMAYKYPEALFLVQFDTHSMIILFFSFFCTIQIVTSIALFLGKRWAWLASIILITINGLLMGIIGIAFAALILFYLTRPKVRAFFKKK